MALEGTKVYFPRDKKEASSNWKQLLAEGAIDSKPKTKSVNPNQAGYARRKLGKPGNAEQRNTDKTKNKLTAPLKRKSNLNDHKDPSSNEEIWFDIDPKLLEQINQTSLYDEQPNKETSAITKGPSKKMDKLNIEKTNENDNNRELVANSSFQGLTRAIAIDCEMVGVGDNGTQSILARISLVNQFGHCIYDKYVKPTEHVTDYRTTVSGIRPEDLEKGEEFKTVQTEVYNIIKGRLLVGHALKHDLKVLFLDHPRSKIRDTSSYFRKIIKGGGAPSLKRLTSQLLGVDIQSGEHDSVQDARAAMRLYTMYKKKWEGSVKSVKLAKKSK